MTPASCNNTDFCVVTNRRIAGDCMWPNCQHATLAFPTPPTPPCQFADHPTPPGWSSECFCPSCRARDEDVDHDPPRSRSERIVGGLLALALIGWMVFATLAEFFYR